MSKRPISVAIVAWIYIAVGVLGIAYHARELNLRDPFESDVVLALGVRLLAIAAGIFILRGRNWARWLALFWMAYHVILSGFHSLPEVAMHAILLAVFAVFLMRSRANAYFRQEPAPNR